MTFTPTDLQKYSSSKASDDKRLGDLLVDLKTSNTVILGYPDDEGIGLNGGRKGAKEGPERARKYFYKMTQDPFFPKDFNIHDAGDLKTDTELKQRHESAKDFTLSLLEKKKTVISLGGGHDYAYPDGAAFLEHCKKNNLKKPLIINVDAHLDVRPLTNGLTSGTPFYRLLEEFDDFEFYQLGIQNQCNSKSHLNWCQNKGGKILSFDEIMLSGKCFSQIATEFLGDSLLRPRPCFLSIDIDAFSSSYAMGCSQSWPTGLEPTPFFKFLEIIKARAHIHNLGIYELSPPLDLDDRTSKLVAQIMYRFLL